GRDADSIAGVFGEALGQKGRRGEDGDRWRGASPRVDARLRPRGPRFVFVGAFPIIALAVALAILLIFGTRASEGGAIVVGVLVALAIVLIPDLRH
ncbi:MAG: hypothetical protein WCJ31_12730, partial [Planctomycetia bacterium]